MIAKHCVGSYETSIDMIKASLILIW